MLNEPTMEKLMTLRLNAQAAAWTEQQRSPDSNSLCFDERLALLVDAESTLVVQVNGKLRGRVTLRRGATEEEAIAAARADEKVAPHLAGKTLRRAVYVADRLLNLVVA